MKETLIIALDNEQRNTLARSGTMARSLFALTGKPEEGMSIAEVCEITGMKPSNVYAHGLRPLFNAQLVERIKRKDQDAIYRIRGDEAGYGIWFKSSKTSTERGK